MNPTKRHHGLFDLDFKQFDFVNHGTLVSAAGLLWEDERCDVKLALPLLACKDGAGLHLAESVIVRATQEGGDDF